MSGTGSFDDAGARDFARQVAAGLPDRNLAGDVETALHTLLATTDRHAWEDLLTHGVTLVSHGRLVWLRPLLAELRPADERESDVREYSVRFATTSGSGERHRERTLGADSALLLGFSTASAVASAMILGVPQLRAESAARRSETQRRNAISGRTLFIGGNKPFLAGVRVDVYVDGVRHRPDAVHDRGLRVEFPGEYTGVDAPRPPMDEPAAALPPGEARLGPDRVVLNAVDMGPLLAALHRAVLGAGTGAGTAERFMTEARELLNERAARTRGRWWMTNGDISGEIHVPGAAGRRSFRGRLRVRAEIDALEFAGTTDGVQIREDLGGGTARGSAGRAAAARASPSATTRTASPCRSPTGPPTPPPRACCPCSASASTAAPAPASRSPRRPWATPSSTSVRHRPATGPGCGSPSPSTPRPTRASGRCPRRPRRRSGCPGGTGGARPASSSGCWAPSAPPAWSPTRPRTGPNRCRPPPRYGNCCGSRAPRPYGRWSPRELHPAPRRAPEAVDGAQEGPAEPPALAARRGLGFAMAVDMAGSEVVLDQLSWALKQMVPPAVRRSADWAAVEAQLGLHFGRPALEGRLPLEETVHMVTVGGERYRASVKAILLDRTPGSSYSMTVNARAARTETVTGRRGTEWSAEAGAGGGVLVPLGGSTRLRVGGITARGGFERSEEEQFTTANTVYRRTEVEGEVDEGVYRTVWELSLGPERPDRRRPAERWWIERPYLTTTIVVPRHNVPAEPRDPARTAELGRTTYLRAWPTGQPEVDFARGHTGGVYPAFLAMPQLTHLAATGYARLAGLPAGWLADSANWPAELSASTDSTALAARLGVLTGPDGHSTVLPKRDGWSYEVRLRLRAFSGKDLGRTAGDTEIEQYAQSTDRYARAEKSGWQAGLSANIGPQFGVGALASGGAHHEGGSVLARQEGEETAPAHGSHPQGGAGLRAVALAQAGVRWGRGRGRERMRGVVEISRATYREETHVVEATPVLQVLVRRTKGGRQEEFVRYLRVEHGLEMLVPERRVPDLLPPPAEPATAGPGPAGTSEDAARTVPDDAPQAGPSHLARTESGPAPTEPPQSAPEPGQVRATPGESTASTPGVLARTHLLGRPLPGAAHVERLRADDVLKTIVARLEGRGVLGRKGSAREHLLRALGVTFSSDALQTQYTALTGTGVARWFPVSGPFGSTRYVWVMVTADLAAPHAHRSRPKVRLTLRSEGVTEEKSGSERSFHAGAGLSTRTRIGDHEGHGGTEIEASYGMSRERSHETARQVVDIARANTREGSEEFEHHLTFRIRLGATTEPPAALAVPAQAVRDAALRVAALLRGRGAARRSDPVRVWTWQDDGLGDHAPVTGDVRLLVPTHLTLPVEQPVPPVVAPVRPQGTPRWTAPVEDRPATPPEALTDYIHAWDVPAAHAVQRWAKAAALTSVREPDLDRPETWGLTGLDPLTTAGMNYDHHTSSTMLRANIAELLQHRYRVPVGGRTVIVGFELTSATVIGPVEGVEFKARRYQQDHTSPKSEQSSSRGGVISLGPEAGGSADGHRVFDRLGFDVYGVRTGHKEGFEAGGTHEENREATRRYRHHELGVTAVVQLENGARRALRIEVPGGLYAMLPLDRDGRLAGGLEQALPHLFPPPRPTGVPRGPALGEPLDVHPAARTIGIPRAGLPYVPEVVRTLRSLVGQTGRSVPETVWAQLPQRLLSNYRYLVPGEGAFANAGLLVPLGGVEALITLDPRDPRTVTRPDGSYDGPSALETIPEEPESGPESGPESAVSGESGADVPSGPLGLVPTRDTDPEPFHANQAINASYLTGAHVETHAGPTGATRAGISLSYGIGLGPGVLQVARVGAGVSGTANASSRSTSRVGDAEGGHVELANADSTMVAYRPHWTVRVRTEARRRWEDVPPVRVTTEGDHRLLLYVPEHYLQQAPEQVVATGTGGLEHRLPAVYYASGLTGLPALFDRIVAAAHQQGLELPVGSVPRDELLQKLWNLDAHLDEAVGDAAGYAFALHDRHGRPVATVQVRTVRYSRGTRVGATSENAPIENVRTAIDGTSGSHTIGNSTTVSLPSAELDLAPLPFTHPDFGLGASASLAMTWSNSDGNSAGRTGLWVVVPRFTKHTNAYELEFLHYALVAVRGDAEPVATPSVLGRGLVRVRETEAYRHGLPVDEEALPTDDEAAADATDTPGAEAAEAAALTPAPARTVPYEPDRIRGTVPRPDEHVDVPPHVAEGRGIGMGIVEFEEGTVRALRDGLARELVRLGFLPADEATPLAGGRWWTQADELDSLLENQEKLNKWISLRGLESHYDQLHQSGLVITMYRRRGALGTTLDLDAVKITLRASRSEERTPEYLGATDEVAVVNLAMGMDTGGHSSGGSRSVGLSFRLKGLTGHLRGAVTGFDVRRSVGATEGVSYLNNRPELLEYPGTVHKHALYIDLTATLELQHSGLRGRIRPGARDPRPITLAGQRTIAYLPPLGGLDHPGTTSLRRTPASVLDRAVVYHVDVTGLYDAATTVLGELTGPQGHADQELTSSLSTTYLRAHLKEALNGRLTSDHFVDTGFRDTFGAIDVRGRMGRSVFAGATPDKFVLGVIKLWMTQTNATDTSSAGVSWAQAGVTVGGAAGDVSVQGEAGASRNWQWNTSASQGRTGAKELIQLDFNRAYAYRTEVDFEVRSRLEKTAKLLPGTHRSDRQEVTGRTALYLLSEPDALEQYARDVLPVSDQQLVDVMNRWYDGKVRLSGNTVAGVLSRWVLDAPDGPDAPEALDALKASRRDLAGLLARLHDNGGLPVLDERTRTAFNRRFRHDLREPESRFPDVGFPEYLTRQDRGGRILGHSGVHAFGYDDGRSTYDIVRELVDRVAPGLLTSRPELWTGDGRRIGRLQANFLQSLLAEGRDSAMLEDLLSPHGHTFHLVAPEGWLTTGIVAINLSVALKAGPEVRDFRPETGLENYGHGYTGTAAGTSRDVSQALTAGRLGAGEAHTSHSGGIGVGQGAHRGVTRAETGTTEQTAYAWNGTYVARFPFDLTATVTLLDMAGRPLNNLLARFSRVLSTGRPTTGTTTASGVLDLQVPRGLAEFHPLYGPRTDRDLRPLPPLPGDAYVTGVLLDDALPAALRLMTRLFGPDADGVRVRTSLTVRQLMSRGHLTNHLLPATAGGRHLLTDTLFVPGHSSRRARLYLEGDLFDLEVLGPVHGTGTGRYTKHQSGTTASASNDRWRPSGAAGTSAAGVLAPHDPARTPDGHAYPPYTGSGGASASWNTGSNLGGAGTENYRREQHIKQQGPTVLVRLRALYRLIAVLHARNLLGPATTDGATHRSDPFTGDVYVELFESEVGELRDRLRRTPLPPALGAGRWAALDRAHAVDLGALMEQAADEPGMTPARLHQAVARGVRDAAAGPLDAAVLRLDRTALEARARRTVLRWAVDTLRADLAAARSADPGAGTPESLARYERLLDGGREEPPGTDTSGTARPADDSVDTVIREVNRVRDALTAREDLPARPARLPLLVPFTALSVDHLVRDVAHELNLPVRVDVTGPDGRTVSRWAEPFGRVYPFDPRTRQADGTLTAERAQAAGLLTPSSRRAVEELGLDATALGALHRASWQPGLTLDHAVRTEAERRLGPLHPGLPDLLYRAWEAAERPVTEHPAGEARLVLDALRGAVRDAHDLDDGTAVRLSEILTRTEALLAPHLSADRALEDARTEPVQRTGPEAGEATAPGALTEEDRERIGLAFRLRPGDTAVAALEDLLLDAGPGARSFVVPERHLADSHGPLYAVNDGGRITWSGRGDAARPLSEPPRLTGMVATIDLDARGALLDPPPQLLDLGPDAVRFPQLGLGADLPRLLGFGEEPARSVPEDGPDTADRAGTHHDQRARNAVGPAVEDYAHRGDGSARTGDRPSSGTVGDTLGPALGDEPVVTDSVVTGSVVTDSLVTDSVLPDSGAPAGRSGPRARQADPEPEASERSVPVPDALPIVSRRNTRADIGLDFRPDGVRRLEAGAPPEVWTTYVPGPAGPDGVRTHQPERPPWFSLSVSAPVPYFVVADTAYGAVLVRTAEGGDAMRPAEFADHLAALPQLRALPADAPVVLVVSRGGAGGMELPRLVAARTGRTVWSHTGELALRPSPDGTATRITVVGEGEGRRPGAGCAACPTTSVPSRSGSAPGCCRRGPHG